MTAKSTAQYEAEVVCVFNTHTLIRSKEFGFTIRIDAGEPLEKFLIVGDRITFEQNWDWFHNPRAINIKRIEKTPEPTHDESRASCPCGQLLNEGEHICATCRIHGGRPVTALTVSADGVPMVLHTGEVTPSPEPTNDTGYTIRKAERLMMDFIVENNITATVDELVMYASAQDYDSDKQFLIDAFIKFGGTLETPTSATVWPKCPHCGITLETTEHVTCDDCKILMNPANSPAQRMLRGASAYVTFSPASSFTKLLAHADIMGLDREDFETCYMAAGGFIYFDETTDGLDPRDAEIASLKARVAELQHQRDWIGSFFERARDVTYSSLEGAAFDREWLNRLEQLYMQTAKFYPKTEASAVNTSPEYLYAPVNRPVSEAAPKGYTIVSSTQTDATPFGIISYPAPLSAWDAWRYDLKGMKSDYAIGDTVEYVMWGKVKTGKITSFGERGRAYIDDYDQVALCWLHISQEV